MGAGLLPIEDVLDILLGDAESVAVSDRAFEEDLDRDWELLDSVVVQLGQIEVSVGLAADGEFADEGFVGVLVRIVHQKYPKC